VADHPAVRFWQRDRPDQPLLLVGVLAHPLRPPPEEAGVVVVGPIGRNREAAERLGVGAPAGQQRLDQLGPERDELQAIRADQAQGGGAPPPGAG
jgi:hypothetical protein